MSGIKHLKRGVFYEYLPDYAINYFLQNPYLDVWQDSE